MEALGKGLRQKAQGTRLRDGSVWKWITAKGSGLMAQGWKHWEMAYGKRLRARGSRMEAEWEKK
jgi:hypothetical protein